MVEQLGDISQQVVTFEEPIDIKAPVIVEEYTTERRASEIKETAEKLLEPETNTATSKIKLSLKKPGEYKTEVAEETKPLIEEERIKDIAISEVVPQELLQAEVEVVTPKVDGTKPIRRRSIKKPQVESLPEEAPEVTEKLEEKLPKEEEAKPVEQDTLHKDVQSESVEVKKPKEKKLVKKKKTDDLDEITQRLLEQEVERPELEQYEKIEVEIQKKEKPKVSWFDFTKSHISFILRGFKSQMS